MDDYESKHMAALAGVSSEHSITLDVRQTPNDLLILKSLRRRLGEAEPVHPPTAWIPRLFQSRDPDEQYTNSDILQEEKILTSATRLGSLWRLSKVANGDAARLSRKLDSSADPIDCSVVQSLMVRLMQNLTQGLQHTERYQEAFEEVVSDVKAHPVSDTSAFQDLSSWRKHSELLRQDFLVWYDKEGNPRTGFSNLQERATWMDRLEQDRRAGQRTLNHNRAVFGRTQVADSEGRYDEAFVELTKAKSLISADDDSQLPSSLQAAMGILTNRIREIHSEVCQRIEQHEDQVNFELSLHRQRQSAQSPAWNSTQAAKQDWESRHNRLTYYGGLALIFVLIFLFVSGFSRYALGIRFESAASDELKSLLEKGTTLASGIAADHAIVPAGPQREL